MSFWENLAKFKLADFEYTPPKWEEKLDLISDYTSEKSGMSREKIEQLLKFLTDEGVID